MIFTVNALKLNFVFLKVTLYLKERNYIGSDVLERLISHEEILPDPTHPHTQDGYITVFPLFLLLILLKLSFYASY